MSEYLSRLDALRARLADAGIDAALIGIGPDLEYLTGYRAHALERLTMLVVRHQGPAQLVVPVLEAMHFEPIGTDLVAAAWQETEDPVRVVADLLDGARSAVVSDETWARFVLDVQAAAPGIQLGRAAPYTSELRMRKGASEVAALRAVGACVDAVLGDVQEGRVPLVGRSERDVAHDIASRLLAAGHDSAEFHIVASGPNAASPHHDPGDRRIKPNEIVLFDIGGRKNGYSSDSTRCVVTGDPPDEAEEAFAVLEAAQKAAVTSAVVGNTCADVDRAARDIIDAAGWGDRFFHRTGHGIGVAGHEEPYIVAGNERPLEPGFAFSVEPGIYVEGEWGMRIEDIVIVTDGAPILCNQTPTELIRV